MINKKIFPLFLIFPNKCDGHWNRKGHQWAGEIISEYLSEFDVLK